MQRIDDPHTPPSSIRPSSYDNYTRPLSKQIDDVRKRIKLLNWRQTRLLQNLVRLVKEQEKAARKGWRFNNIRDAVIEEHRQLVTWHAMEIVKELNEIRRTTADHLREQNR